jgi:hypothetical protein
LTLPVELTVNGALPFLTEKLAAAAPPVLLTASVTFRLLLELNPVAA